jgi:hypothetical protein
MPGRIAEVATAGPSRKRRRDAAQDKTGDEDRDYEVVDVQHASSSLRHENVGVSPCGRQTLHRTDRAIPGKTSARLEYPGL